jgi:hypothetical protein
MTQKHSALFFTLAATLLAAGCGGASLPSIGSISSPFSNQVSELDRVFLMAAGSWDRNRDSTVTCDEWKAYVADLFNSSDADHDGSLEADDWQRLVAQDRMFQIADMKYYDANNDGKVTLPEMQERPNRAFELLDPGKTCSLSSTQVAGARSKTQYDTAGKQPESQDKSGGAGKASEEAMKH